MSFRGMNVMVTGAAKGIGKATAQAFASAGANLAVCDIDIECLSQFLAETGTEGGLRRVVSRVDVSNEAQVNEFVNSTESILGSVDILVNNAAVYILKPLEAISCEEWDMVMGVNLRSCFLFSKAVLPGMRQRGYGRIINVSSAAGKNGGTICGAHYAASKGGILAFTRHLARQYGRDGITVNAIAPGGIATDMVLNLGQSGVNTIEEGNAVGRLGEASEVAKAVLFLASHEARHITGETLNINGGSIMD